MACANSHGSREVGKQKLWAVFGKFYSNLINIGEVFERTVIAMIVQFFAFELQIVGLLDASYQSFYSIRQKPPEW